MRKLIDVKLLTGLVMSVVIGILIVVIGSLNIFWHGYFCNPVHPSLISEKDIIEYIDLSRSEYHGKIMPTSKGLCGVALLLKSLPKSDAGGINVSIYDGDILIDSVDKELSFIKENEWYRLTFSKPIKPNHEYDIKISAYNCASGPLMPIVVSNYVPNESIQGEGLLEFAYSKAVFKSVERLLIIIILIGLWLLFISHTIIKNISDIHKKFIQKIGIAIILVGTMTWTFTYNSIDTNNDIFSEIGSEELVTNLIDAQMDGIDVDGEGYNLGWYTTVGKDFLTDYITWRYGYNMLEPKIALPLNGFNISYAVEGNSIEFESGDIISITNISVEDKNLIVNLDHDGALLKEKYGDIANISYIDSQGHYLAKGIVGFYKSQVGIQGLFFRRIASLLTNKDYIDELHFFCSFLTAVVFVLICWLLTEKYDSILGLIFYMVFLLSPWTVSFARNLYWVEFTWFVPMLLGLIVAFYKNKTIKKITIILIYLSILVKCLCGYEYITTIMMASIAFVIRNAINLFIMKDNEGFKMSICDGLAIGVADLLGFASAMMIHAPLRANGNLWEGLKLFYTYDLRRRAIGGELSDFDPAYWDSFNASKWEVLCRYFRFDTDIVAGIPGNVFPVLCLIPIFIFIIKYHRGKAEIEKIAIYIVFLITSISWFWLGKAHSYIHTFMNFVMWYFGFVQICFYNIIKTIISEIRRLKSVVND